MWLHCSRAQAIMAPKKRKSTSENAPKAQDPRLPKGSLGEGQAMRDKLQSWLLASLCVLFLSLRLREKVFPAGGIDEYLTSQYPDEAQFPFVSLA